MKLLQAITAAALLVPMSALADVSLSTLDGTKQKGQIVSIDGKQVVLKTAAGNTAYELTKLNSIDIAEAKGPAPTEKFIEVELLDGSQFRCADFRIRGKTAVLTLLGAPQAVEVPASTVLYMIRDISDAKLAQAFRDILSKRGKRDIWIVKKGDSLDGLLGTFGDGDAAGDKISFESEAAGNKIDVDMKRVYGMIFNPPAVAVAQTVCKVIDVRKNVLYAKAITLGGEKGVTVESVTGVKVDYPSIESLSKLDFSAGSMLFLSNADPIKVEQSSTEGIPEPYRRDKNLDNNDLKINGQKYGKGLALHSRTMLAYDLGGKYKVFQATAGVDDSVEGDSTVTLTIEADFKPIFREVIRRRDKPKVLNLSVLNVKELRITVESEFLDLGNQVNLVDARVMK